MGVCSGLTSDTLDALDWMRANAPAATTVESSSTKPKTQSRSQSRSSTPDNLRSSSLSRSSTPASVAGSRSSAYNAKREASASVSLRSGYNATPRSTETAFGTHTTSSNNMHVVAQSRRRSATGSGVSSEASSRLGSPVDARTQGSVRGTSPSSFDPAFGVQAYPRLSADVKPQAGHKRWL